MISDRVELEDELLFLKISDKNQREINGRLNIEMVESRTRLIKEKEEVFKNLKNEVKVWKKKHGKEKKKVIKLKSKISDLTSVKSTDFPTNPIAEDIDKNELKNETELEDIINEELSFSEEISCSICTEPLFSYTQKFSEGLPINPACSKCNGSDDESEEDVVDVVLTQLSPCTTPPLAQTANSSESPPTTSTPPTVPLATTTSSELYEDLVKFIESGPEGNLDIMIFKLESLKNLLQTGQFDSLLETANKLRNKKGVQDDDYEDDEFDDDIPPHHYGSDGEVLID